MDKDGKYDMNKILDPIMKHLQKKVSECVNKGKKHFLIFGIFVSSCTIVWINFCWCFLANEKPGSCESSLNLEMCLIHD